MKQLSLLAASLMFSAGVLAGAADNVSVQDPYVRLAPPNAPATGAFMVIKNNRRQRRLGTQGRQPGLQSHRAAHPPQRRRRHENASGAEHRHQGQG